MKAFFAQLRRDFTDWWLLWAVATLAGLVPLLLPILYTAQGQAALDLRLAAAVVGGGLLALASLALLGDGLLARDVAEGRFGFYLTRPLPTATLWAARLTTAILVFALVVVAVSAPAWLAFRLDGSAIGPTETRTPLSTVAVTAPGATLGGLFGPMQGGLFFRALGVFGLAGLAMSLLLMAHAVSTSARSRSPWTLLDVVGFVVTAHFLLTVRDTLLSASALGALVVAERLFVLALAVVLVVAGFRQVDLGRADLLRGHGAFSRTLWPLLTVVLVALVSWSHWVTTPEAADLTSAEQVWFSPRGEHVLIEGEAQRRFGMRTAFVVSTSSTPRSPEERSPDQISSGRAPQVVGSPTAIAAARGDDRMAWIRCKRVQRPDCRLWTWSPSRDAEPVMSDVFIERWDHQLAVSPFGELVAIRADRSLEVWEPDTPRLIFSIDRYALQPTFLSADRLRYLHSDPDLGVTRLEEIDLQTRSVRVLAEFSGETLLRNYRLSASGRLAAVGSFLPPSFRLVDTRTGTVYDLSLRIPPGTLHAVRFAGEDLLLLQRDEDASYRLLRVELPDDSAAGLRITELPLPAGLSTETYPRLEPYEEGVLLSGSVTETAAAAWSFPATRLPESVEPLADQALWTLDLHREDAVGSDDVWRLVARGVSLQRSVSHLGSDPMDVPPSKVLLLAGGSAVVQLQDGALRPVVPALPDSPR